MTTAAKPTPDPRDPLGLVTDAVLEHAIRCLPSAYGAQPGEMEHYAREAIVGTGLPLQVFTLRDQRDRLEGVVGLFLAHLNTPPPGGDISSTGHILRELAVEGKARALLSEITEYRKANP